ncbi:UDP-N-acetylmuramoyl-L-alanine--D-glutamate ligase [Aliikangiella maris]|uniref:UDP-N-acetylmuramoyl-L-alanine--D-glutamate ligase n=2 Tax=Aliikangiella maris TaxID=3162458 RepID=A0ABV3MJF6_9GAMM
MINNAYQNLTCVFGLGQSGLSAARYFQRIGEAFFVVDTRESPAGANLVNTMNLCQGVILGEIAEHLLMQAKQIILSPGISPKIPLIVSAKNAGVEVFGDVDIFMRQTKGKVIAITGSNGKSTVTDLTCRLLQAGGYRAEIGGNFGIPVLDYLPEDKADIYVLELSSFQLDTTRYIAPDVAVVLNVTEDHMDRYSQFDEYQQSKLRVLPNAKYRLVNLDDKNTWPIDVNIDSSFSLYNKDAKYYLEKDEFPKNESIAYQSESHVVNQFSNLKLCRQGQQLIHSDALAITGKHNWMNILASIALIDGLGIEISEPMLAALKHYRGLAHRFQWAANESQIDWINDSKATNVGATLAAINAVEQQLYSSVILIAGGDAKGADLSELKSVIEEKISVVIVLGKDAALFVSLIKKIPVIQVADMFEAVAQARTLVAQKNSEMKINLNQSTEMKKALVLLSPACASLDMFNNFEHRGEIFCQAIRESV